MSSSRHQDIIDQFCVLYEIARQNGHPYCKPSVQKPLRARMEKLIELHSDWKENHYVQYFLETLNNDLQPEREHRLAHLHLVAYFDLSRCYFVRKLSQRYPFPEATLVKFFDLTTEFLYDLSEFKKCLNRYDEQDARGANLKTYLQGIFRNIIFKNLHTESRWHILCNVDLTSLRKFNHQQQTLREALERQGITDPNLSRYIFAWKYFVPVYKNNRLYSPTRSDKKKWPDPALSDFEEAARDYNTNRFQPDAPLQVSSSSEVTPEIIRQWMNTCIEALQQYSQIVEISYDGDADKKQDYFSASYGEDLESEREPVAFLQETEHVLQDEIKRIENSLGKIRSKIPANARKAVMPLCYPHELSLLVQDQLASKVGVNQGTVARYISNTYKLPLLNKLDKLIEINLGTDYYTWAQNFTKRFLEENFSNPNYSDVIQKNMIDKIQNLTNDEQLIIKLYYGQKMTVEEVATYLEKEKNIESLDVNQVLTTTKQELQEAISEQINTFKLECVNAWLKRHYKQIIHYQLLDALNQLELSLKEIIKLKYCQNLNEQQLERFRAGCDVGQAIANAKQQLGNFLIQWADDAFRLSLETEKEQVGEVVEVWLKTLHSVEL